MDTATKRQLSVNALGLHIDGKITDVMSPPVPGKFKGVRLECA